MKSITKLKKLIKSQVSDEIITKYQQIKTYIIDTDEYINDLCKKGGVVFEGAQGTMLDIDHGTFLMSHHLIQLCLVLYQAQV